MKKYEVRVTIRNEYVVDVLADNSGDAYRVAADANPEDIGHYISTDRETDIEDETEITDVLGEITGTEWWIGTNGNTHTRYATEVTPGVVVFIVDATEHTEAPQSLDDVVHVMIASGEWEQNHEMKWAGTLRDLIEDFPHTLSEIADEATVQNAKCGECGLAMMECANVSAYHETLTDDVTRLLGIMGPNHPTTESLRVMLDAYLTHSVPTCTKVSRA